VFSALLAYENEQRDGRGRLLRPHFIGLPNRVPLTRRRHHRHRPDPLCPYSI
jgi:hypothetical protein